jgi:homocitrate synthase NifV
MVQSTGNERIKLVDSTLRDGEQAPAVSFTEGQSLEIALLLADAGLRELEVGTPAMGAAEQQKMRRIASALPHVRCTAWCRTREDDLGAAVSAGVPAVHLSVPTSGIQLGALGRDWSWVMVELKRLLPLSLAHFDYVSVGAQDASRAPVQRLRMLAELAASLGAHRLRLADTVGLWHPVECYRVVSEVRSVAPRLEIGVHTHDDLGMATANAVTALSAGAHSVDVTVNGLGERAGNAALEEVVMALETAEPASSGIDPRKLSALSERVAEYSGRELWPSKAVVGSKVFQHESGIHVHAMLRDSRSYEPFAPSSVGREGRTFVLGKHSGNRRRHVPVVNLLASEPASARAK